MASPLITLRDASVAHSEFLPPAIEQISLTIKRGDWIAITGANGSGKTTLLAAIGGVLPARTGSIERAQGLRTALLLQEPDNQFVASSVRRELAMSIPLHIDEATRSARLADAIERFELAALLERNPHRLSGGEKQRLALATVWLEGPDVLLLDEPLSYLDSETRQRVIVFVRELNASGVAVVWATPGDDDVDLARDYVMLEEGQVTRSGPARGAGGAIPGAGPDASLFRAGPDPQEAIVQRSARRALALESVSFAYENTPVFREISLEAKGGETVGITGRNASGKSTLLLLAGGALKPSSGRVVRSTREHGVLYLPQSPERLFFCETVLQEVSFGLTRRGIGREEARQQAIRALSEASLDPAEFATRSPFELSFGEMRRVAFAIAFALKPELLLLDEPASCLDLSGRRVLDALVQQCAASGGSVLVASHDDLSESGYDRVCTLANGRLE